MRRGASGRDRLHGEGKKRATSRKRESKSTLVRVFARVFRGVLDERTELNPDGRCRSASVEVIEFDAVWLAALDDFRNWLIREAA
jgi:hypothetical protein